MSELPHHDRVRLLIQELDRVHRESERLRALMVKIQRESLEYSDPRGMSDPFTDTEDGSENPT
jgi:hypothetical protein